jgi:His-Xaa-Ser system radical SAM maturase HxsC
MRLHTAGIANGFRNPTLARVTRTAVGPPDRGNTALVVSSIDDLDPDPRGYAAIVCQQRLDQQSIGSPVVHSVRDIDHLRQGHVIAIEPMNGFIRTVYRPESQHNILFATERCNSNCLMCSQPPKDADDTDALTDRNLQLIDFMSPATEYLTITGGEPTLLGGRLFAILAKLRDRLPETDIHILTNGRRFAWPEFTAEFAAVSHPRLSLGIPLYSDYAPLHDYVVQARGAFDQTVLGLHQLARHGINIEVRVVLHALTTSRLKLLAEYISRNLTFVDHVAFMGLEQTGYTPRNIEELWIDPVDYQEELEASVTVLARFGIEARIYNHQLCVLKPSLWKYSKQSISDWKNIYMDCCTGCHVRERCGGFFQWAPKRQSRSVRPLSAAECK